MLVNPGVGYYWCWLLLVLVITGVGYYWFWLFLVLVIPGVAYSCCWFFLVLVITGVGFSWCRLFLCWLFLNLVISGAGHSWSCFSILILNEILAAAFHGPACCWRCFFLVAAVWWPLKTPSVFVCKCISSDFLMYRPMVSGNKFLGILFKYLVWNYGFVCSKAFYTNL